MMPLPDPKEYQCRRDIVWYLMQENGVIDLNHPITGSIAKYSKHELSVSLKNLVQDRVVFTDPWEHDVYKVDLAIRAIGSLRSPGSTCPMCGSLPHSID